MVEIVVIIVAKPKQNKTKQNIIIIVVVVVVVVGSSGSRKFFSIKYPLLINLTAILAAHQNPEIASRILQRQLSNIQTWLDKWSMRASEMQSAVQCTYHIHYEKRKLLDR